MTWRQLTLLAIALVPGCTGVVTAPAETSHDPFCDDGRRGTCDATARPDSPMRRLTAPEYRRTIADLFGGADVGSYGLPAPTSISGYTTDARSQAASPELIEAEIDGALSIAEQATAVRASWAPCTEETAACLDTIAQDLSFRAFRRPLTDDEATEISGFAAERFLAHGFVDALADVIGATLLDPRFLFMPEPTGTLDGYAVASRLSYFLWDSMPDDALFDAAARGDLDDPDGVATQARRMLEADRAREPIIRFFEEWLALDRITALALDPTAYPELDDGLRASYRGSMRRFIEWAIFEEGSLDALLSSNSVFVDDDLAALLDLPAPDGDGFVRVELDERRGVLTQPAVLASTSKGLLHRPVFRGLTVLEDFLCVSIGNPPSVPPLDEARVNGSEPLTTRQLVEESHASPTCLSCHRQIDGVGFTFEHYDALGRYRTEENGVPVDSSGLIPGVACGAPVENALDAVEQIASSVRTRDCVSSHFYQYTVGRAPDRDGVDECAIRTLADAWESSSGDPAAWVSAMVTTPAFRERPTE